MTLPRNARLGRTINHRGTRLITRTADLTRIIRRVLCAGPRYYSYRATYRVTMSKRKNLKIAEDTYDDLKDEKRDMETWDSMFRRLMRESANE